MNNSHPTAQLPTSPKRLHPAKSFILPLAVAVGFGIGSGAMRELSIITQQPQTRPAIQQNSEQSWTLTDYSRLNIGMTLADVELILGVGVEESRSDEVAQFLWQNPDSSFIRLAFSADKLVKKQQQQLDIVCR